jgi:hypothetical protein
VGDGAGIYHVDVSRVTSDDTVTGIGKLSGEKFAFRLIKFAAQSVNSYVHFGLLYGRTIIFTFVVPGQ